MVKGLKISAKKNIPDAKETDLVVDSLLLGTFKIEKILTFKRGGDLTVMNSGLGLNAYIQRHNHDMGYVPAYLGYAVYGDATVPSFINIPYNDFVAVDGRSDFINVTATKVIVGFDSANTDLSFIRVILFAEKLSDD